ncbi:MAG TPA: TldD/PmbA family protein [Thermoplasmata archaeon]|nr:TldD/PmbA family protein [Thermoplasmata archaeon]
MVSESAAGLFDRATGALTPGASADARFASSVWTTIRFANGEIHQPHFERTHHVSFRVAREGRIGIATSVDLTPAGLREVARVADALARYAPVEKGFRGFPADHENVEPVAFSRSTAALRPEEVTRLAERVLTAAQERAPGARVAGVVNVGWDETRILNTAGLDRSSRTSAAQASVLVERPELEPPVSGWSEGAHWDAARLFPERLGHEAAERVPKSPPRTVKPGVYPVVLAGPAVAEAMVFLGHLGFGGHAEVEGWSCLRSHRGRRVAPSRVELVDDARSRQSIPRAVDNEGTRTRRTALISQGVAGPAVTDLLTSVRLERPRTGHALPPEAPWGEWGPVPSHLLLRAGEESADELVRELRHGLLVTRFHYVRVVDPGRGVLTGMTRDGTYRIRNGEVAEPVRNLRFTESLLTLLRGIEGLGRERRIYADERGTDAATVPSLRAKAFRFTSATLF